MINECGYEAATFQAIALRAGFSRPTMHYYFHTKEEIFEILQQEAYLIVTECIAAALREDGLRKQLSAFVVAARSADRSDGSLMRFIVTSRFEQHRCPSLRGTASPVSGAVADFYSRIVDQAIATGELPADADAAAVVNMLSAMFWGMGFLAGFVHAADGLADIAKQLDRMFRKGLLVSADSAPVPTVAPPPVAMVDDRAAYATSADPAAWLGAVAFGG